MLGMLTWPSTELMQLSTGSRSPSCPATLLVSAPPPGPAPALPLVSRLYRRLLNLKVSIHVTSVILSQLTCRLQP